MNLDDFIINEYLRSLPLVPTSSVDVSFSSSQGTPLRSPAQPIYVLDVPASRPLKHNHVALSLVQETFNSSLHSTKPTILRNPETQTHTHHLDSALSPPHSRAYSGYPSIAQESQESRHVLASGVSGPPTSQIITSSPPTIPIYPHTSPAIPLDSYTLHHAVSIDVNPPVITTTAGIKSTADTADPAKSVTTAPATATVDAANIAHTTFAYEPVQYSYKPLTVSSAVATAPSFTARLARLRQSLVGGEGNPEKSKVRKYPKEEMERSVDGSSLLPSGKSLYTPNEGKQLSGKPSGFSERIRSLSASIHKHSMHTEPEHVPQRNIGVSKKSQNPPTVPKETLIGPKNPNSVHRELAVDHGDDAEEVHRLSLPPRIQTLHPPPAPLLSRSPSRSPPLSAVTPAVTSTITSTASPLSSLAPPRIAILAPDTVMPYTTIKSPRTKMLLSESLRSESSRMATLTPGQTPKAAQLLSSEFRGSMLPSEDVSLVSLTCSSMEAAGLEVSVADDAYEREDRQLGRYAQPYGGVCAEESAVGRGGHVPGKDRGEEERGLEEEEQDVHEKNEKEEHFGEEDVEHEETVEYEKGLEHEEKIEGNESYSVLLIPSTLHTRMYTSACIDSNAVNTATASEVNQDGVEGEVVCADVRKLVEPDELAAISDVNVDTQSTDMSVDGSVTRDGVYHAPPHAQHHHHPHHHRQDPLIHAHHHHHPPDPDRTHPHTHTHPHTATDVTDVTDVPVTSATATEVALPAADIYMAELTVTDIEVVEMTATDTSLPDISFGDTNTHQTDDSRVPKDDGHHDHTGYSHVSSTDTADGRSEASYTSNSYSNSSDQGDEAVHVNTAVDTRGDEDASASMDVDMSIGMNVAVDVVNVGAAEGTDRDDGTDRRHSHDNADSRDSATNDGSAIMGDITKEYSLHMGRRPDVAVSNSTDSEDEDSGIGVGAEDLSLSPPIIPLLACLSSPPSSCPTTSSPSSPSPSSSSPLPSIRSSTSSSTALPSSTLPPCAPAPLMLTPRSPRARHGHRHHPPQQSPRQLAPPRPHPSNTAQQSPVSPRQPGSAQCSATSSQHPCEGPPHSSHPRVGADDAHRPTHTPAYIAMNTETATLPRRNASANSDINVTDDDTTLSAMDADTTTTTDVGTHIITDTAIASGISIVVTSTNTGTTGSSTSSTIGAPSISSTAAGTIKPPPHSLHPVADDNIGKNHVHFSEMYFPHDTSTEMDLSAALHSMSSSISFSPVTSQESRKTRKPKKGVENRSLKRLDFPVKNDDARPHGVRVHASVPHASSVASPSSLPSSTSSPLSPPSASSSPPLLAPSTLSDAAAPLLHPPTYTSHPHAGGHSHFICIEKTDDLSPRSSAGTRPGTGTGLGTRVNTGVNTGRLRISADGRLGEANASAKARDTGSDPGRNEDTRAHPRPRPGTPPNTYIGAYTPSPRDTRTHSHPDTTTATHTGTTTHARTSSYIRAHAPSDVGSAMNQKMLSQEKDGGRYMPSATSDAKKHGKNGNAYSGDYYREGSLPFTVPSYTRLEDRYLYEDYVPSLSVDNQENISWNTRKKPSENSSGDLTILGVPVLKDRAVSRILGALAPHAAFSSSTPSNSSAIPPPASSITSSPSAASSSLRPHKASYKTASKHSGAAAKILPSTGGVNTERILETILKPRRPRLSHHLNDFPVPVDASISSPIPVPCYLSSPLLSANTDLGMSLDPPRHNGMGKRRSTSRDRGTSTGINLYTFTDIGRSASITPKTRLSSSYYRSSPDDTNDISDVDDCHQLDLYTEALLLSHRYTRKTTVVRNAAIMM